jgi:hypothetical protein
VSKLIKLASQGVAEAQLYLGLAYRNGNFFAQNDRAAFGWVFKAAEQGDVQAENVLGDFYYAGRAVTADHKAAADWWGKAVAQEDAFSQLKLASLYADGDGVEKDLAKARALYSGFGAFIYEGRAKTELARIDGHPYSDELQAAFKAFDDQDHAAAASKAEPFAKQGVGAAQFLLGEVAYTLRTMLLPSAGTARPPSRMTAMRSSPSARWEARTASAKRRPSNG